MRSRDNPFAPTRLEQALPFDPGLIGSSWQALEARWLALGRRAVITGRHGAGKTTLLRAWAERFAGDQPPVWLFFNLEQPRLTDSHRQALAECSGRLLLVDGIGHLLPWDRLVIFRAAKLASGVLMARHRRGLWPVLLHLKSSTALAERLLERAAPEQAARFLPTLDQRLRHQRGNLRELWLDCYDELAADPAAIC